MYDLTYGQTLARWIRKLHPLEPSSETEGSNAETHEIHTLPTDLPAASAEPHLATSGVKAFCQISDNLPCTPSQKLPSCCPSEAHFNTGLFQGRVPYLL